MTSPEWIAADWGTTNLRLWAMAGADVQQRRSSDQGMSRLRPEEFSAVLARATEGWGDAPVIACGMVGSRQGWIEAPYVTVPVAAAPRLIPVPGQSVWIACGVRQTSPPDVMRGEETQLAGLLARQPDFDGAVCLPGTHTKWVHVSGGMIRSFQSFMTGEVFALLSNQSVLRHTVGDPGDEGAFDAAVQDALTHPDRAYGSLFQLRAGALVGDLAPATAGSRLSGTLIGWELAGARPFWQGRDVAIIGADRLSALYARALSAEGVISNRIDAEAATLAGLYRAWKTLGDQKI